MFRISLIHQGTKETRSFDVEVVTESYVSIRWGLSGYYDLYLKTNQLIPRSITVRRRRKPAERNLWCAEDIVAVRKMAKDWLKEREAERTAIPNIDMSKAIEKHNEAMPGRAKPLSSSNEPCQFPGCHGYGNSHISECPYQ